MARLLTSTLAGWLFALSCVGLLQVARCQADQSECVDELFVKLDNPDLDVDGARELLDKVEDKDATKIGRVSVAKILKFDSSYCEPKDLVDLHLLSRKAIYSCPSGVGSRHGWRTNYGVHLFLSTYRAERTETCRKQIVANFEQFWRQFPDIREKVENFYAEWQSSSPVHWKKLFHEELSNMPDLIRDLTRAQVRLDNHFTYCFELIDGMYGYLPCHKLVTLYVKHETVDRSLKYMQACKSYLDGFCDHIKDRRKKRNFPRIHRGFHHRYNTQQDNCKVLASKEPWLLESMEYVENLD